MPTTLTDSAETAQLLARIAAGDQSAIPLLFDRHLPEVRQSVERRLRPQTNPRFDASDVVQETHHLAQVGLADFLSRRPMPFRLWLLSTAQHRVIDFERAHLWSAKRTLNRELPLPDASSLGLVRQLVANHPSPSDVASMQERARIVRECLAELEEVPRQVLLLRVFDGLTNVEVAAVLSLHPDAVKRRFSRTLVQLRALLLKAGLRSEAGDE